MKCDLQMAILGMVLILCNINYCLAAPFLPIFLEIRGVSATWTGFIFAIFSVASTITSILIGEIVDKVGHKRLLAYSTLFMSACTMAFGFINYIDQNWLIIFVACILRVGQGLAYGTINTVVYSFCAQAYTEDVEKVIAVMEGVMGIGFTLGPVLGNYIYNAMGFSMTYYFVGSTLAPTALLVLCLRKPSKSNQSKQNDKS